jgi:hypothetical protein
MFNPGQEKNAAMAEAYSTAGDAEFSEGVQKKNRGS